MSDSAKRIFWIVVIAGALVSSLGMGIRQNFGQFLPPMTADLGLGREAFAFAMALQNILWGVFTPITGALADKYGSGKMIALGGAVYAGGLVILANATGTTDLNIGAGLFIGFGQAAAGFAVVLTAVARRVSAEKRSLALGITSQFGAHRGYRLANGTSVHRRAGDGDGGPGGGLDRQFVRHFRRRPGADLGPSRARSRRA